MQNLIVLREAVCELSCVQTKKTQDEHNTLQSATTARTAINTAVLVVAVVGLEQYWYWGIGYCPLFASTK